MTPSISIEDLLRHKKVEFNGKASYLSEPLNISKLTVTRAAGELKTFINKMVGYDKTGKGVIFKIFTSLNLTH